MIADSFFLPKSICLSVTQKKTSKYKVIWTFVVFFMYIHFSGVTCHELVLKKCQKMGYNSTSVTTKYQKLVESSTIFHQVDSNSAKLRKVICMEIAPPCDKQNSGKLQVPCRSLCNDAFNESRSQFMKIFKNQRYCSALPNATTSRQELCQLKTWPDNVYYPSGLWMSLNKKGILRIF